MEDVMSEGLPAESQGKIIVFGSNRIRRAWHNDQWYFSVVDIIGALTDSANPRNYWNMMKARELEQSEVQLSTLCVQLKLPSADGKAYKTDCVNVEAAFRVIQSVPGAKAEPFKRWLAQVGYERIQEIENPELAQQRMRETYKQKGYPPTGWRNAFAELLSVTSYLASGRIVEFRNTVTSPSSPPRFPRRPSA
jgi:DNA-damage-inducible protein D